MQSLAILAGTAAALFIAMPATALTHVQRPQRPAIVILQAPRLPTITLRTRAPLSTAVPAIQIAPTTSTPTEAQTTLTQPQSSVAATPASTPSTSDFASQVEREVHRLTNDERVAHGFSSLQNDSRLAAVARAHSEDMLAKNYFSHTNQSGCSVSCRADNAGYAWRALGENIHTMWGYQMSPTDTAKKIVTDWMMSPGHRANILNATFTMTGIGLAVQGTTIYSTANYSLPR